jgi:hypothetical protein
MTSIRFMPHTWSLEIIRQLKITSKVGCFASRMKKTCFDLLYKGCWYIFFLDDYWSDSPCLQHWTDKKYVLINFFFQNCPVQPLFAGSHIHDNGPHKVRLVQPSGYMDSLAAINFANHVHGLVAQFISARSIYLVVWVSNAPPI